MSSLPGCIGLDAATAAVESEEIAELQQAVVEELGISMEELRQFIDEELEKMDCIQQRKKQLAELETWVIQKESEVAHVDQLFDDASRAVTNCESLVKDFYSKLGLQYRDSSSEDEASRPTEIIEIPDEDDDVLSIDSDYTRHTLDGAACLLNSNKYFPSRVSIKESSVAKLGSVCRRIYRIFSHAYFHHRQIFDEYENETFLCHRFTKFVMKYNLMSKDNLIVPILEEEVQNSVSGESEA
ncbi:histone-lysine N-methyltransferase SETDB1-like [Pontoporia blainvillei]|uniref:Histone-lysine N-methyltransferase SETDB1-like n=1 Tax=Pontoporia blainvillei TaxID=48723 RepID=A0ABX0S8R0_PONBL|nr:histone-lysine N-methyltransferase SETDB1-like [Pontoporia blainvillei]